MATTKTKRPTPRLLDKAAKLVDEQPVRHPVVFDIAVEKSGINPNESTPPDFEPWDDLRSEQYELEYPQLSLSEAMALLSRRSQVDISSYTVEDATVLLKNLETPTDTLLGLKDNLDGPESPDGAVRGQTESEELHEGDQG